MAAFRILAAIRLPAAPLADLQRLEMLRDLDPELRRALSRMWTEIKVR